LLSFNNDFKLQFAGYRYPIPAAPSSLVPQAIPADEIANFTLTTKKATKMQTPTTQQTKVPKPLDIKISC